MYVLCLKNLCGLVIAPFGRDDFAVFFETFNGLGYVLALHTQSFCDIAGANRFACVFHCCEYFVFHINLNQSIKSCCVDNKNHSQIWKRSQGQIVHLLQKIAFPLVASSHGSIICRYRVG